MMGLGGAGGTSSFAGADEQSYFQTLINPSEFAVESTNKKFPWEGKKTQDSGRSLSVENEYRADGRGGALVLADGGIVCID